MILCHLSHSLTLGLSLVAVSLVHFRVVNFYLLPPVMPGKYRLTVVLLALAVAPHYLEAGSAYHILKSLVSGVSMKQAFVKQCHSQYLFLFSMSTICSCPMYEIKTIVNSLANHIIHRFIIRSDLT